MQLNKIRAYRIGHAGSFVLLGIDQERDGFGPAGGALDQAAGGFVAHMPRTFGIENQAKIVGAAPDQRVEGFRRFNAADLDFDAHDCSGPVRHPTDC